MTVATLRCLFVHCRKCRIRRSVTVYGQGLIVISPNAHGEASLGFRGYILPIYLGQKSLGRQIVRAKHPHTVDAINVYLYVPSLE